MSKEEAEAQLKELAGDALMLVHAAAQAIERGSGYDSVVDLAGNLSKVEAQAAAAILAIGAAEQAAGLEPEP